MGWTPGGGSAPVCGTYTCLVATQEECKVYIHLGRGEVTTSDQRVRAFASVQASLSSPGLRTA